MTINEIMHYLLEMIGGVAWVELGFCQRSIRYCGQGSTTKGWWMGHASGTSRITEHEAQALIEKAAIEWLKKGDRPIDIHWSTICGWCVHVWSTKLPHPTLLVEASGHKTLLEALHAAVEAIKERV